MASLKDLMKAFLLEEVDDDDDDELEEEIQNEEVKPVVQSASAAVENAPAAPVVTPVQETPVIEEPVPSAALDSSAKRETSFLESISSVSSINQGQMPSARRKSTVRRPSSTANRKPQEYKAVISPIFGNVENSKKEYDAIHDAVNLPKPEEGFEMVRVISPMYGSTSAKAKKAVPQKEKKAAPKSKAAYPAKVQAAEVPAKANDTSLSSFLTRESVKAPASEKQNTPAQQTLKEDGEK